MIGHVTRFASVKCTRGVRSKISWPTFLAEFDRPFVRARKDIVPGWSATTYEDNDRREGNGAIELSAFVGEYDGTLSIVQALDLWGEFYGKIYTTFSHRLEAPRFRFVLPYSRAITPAEHRRICTWAGFTGGPLDMKCSRDVKRFWYLPSCPPGGPFEAHDSTGAILNVDPILDRFPETPAAPTAAVEVLASHRVGQPSSVIERARAYLRKTPGAVSGQGGHATTFWVARALVSGFGLDAATALVLLSEWNVTCQPPWSPRELAHKVKEADSKPFEKPRGFLLRGRTA